VFGTLHTVQARQHSYGAPKCEAGSVVRGCSDCGVVEQEARSSCGRKRSEVDVTGVFQVQALEAEWIEEG
jgi:hypothetical protein